MNPEKHLLESIEWQFFCTYTFKRVEVSEAVWLKMYFSLVRERAEFYGVHFSKLLWVLRKEKGEATQRPHFHALIAGLPNSALHNTDCLAFMTSWERFGGGIARVRLYDKTLTGVEYVMKGVDTAFTNAGANWYELSKFGASCDVMLSMSVCRHLENRSRFGHRDRDGLFEGIKGQGLINLRPNKREPRKTDTLVTRSTGQ